MKPFVIKLLVGAVASAVCTSVWAGELSVTNDFQAGQTASAAQVNQNFTDVETAVNDNDDRIDANATNIGINSGNITSNATNIGVNAGNITTNASAITALQSGSGCPSDMTAVGSFCIDTYEAVLYDQASGGNVIDTSGGDTIDCDDSASDCMAGNPDAIYARSENSSQVPAQYVTWFQAAAACANVGKRLPTNAEWQVAAFGTSDLQADGCHLDFGGTNPDPIASNAITGCASDTGVRNMAGNVREWVADWIQSAPTTYAGGNGTNGNYGGDTVSAVNPAASDGNGTHMPAAIYRGGGSDQGGSAGVYNFAANAAPSFSRDALGFRCAK